MADSDSNATTLRERLRAERDKFAAASQLAQNTRTGYRYGWATFMRFAGRLDASPLPATVETVSLYAVDALAAGLKASTVNHRLCAVARMHRDNGHTSPVTHEIYGLLLGAKRLRFDQLRQVTPLSLEDLRAISTALVADDSTLSIRNHAICIVGFASALRGANLAMLLLEDVEFVEQGLLLNIRRSKTDQEGKGRLVGIPHGKHQATCPVKCLESWIARRGNCPGPLFSRLDQYRDRNRAIRPERICQIVKQAIARTGKDPTMYGAHSMRSGLVTSAGEAGATELQIASQTGHQDMKMVRRYFRRQDVFRGNPVAMLDL